MLSCAFVRAILTDMQLQWESLCLVVLLQGCIELLERYNVPIAGKNAVVVGRSNIVGLPAALLLQNRDATVTIVHSRTKDAQKICAGVCRATA